MKVYVGTWAKYNAGNLDGKHFDLEDYGSYEDFIEDAKEYHSDESDPELDFQDYEIENDFEELFEDDIRSYFEARDELERCHEDPDFVSLVAKHLSWSAKETADNIRNIGDYAYYIDSFEDLYSGEAQNLSQSLRDFIDWEKYAEYIGEDYEPYKDGYVVFTNC